MTGTRGPKSDPSKPHSRVSGNRKRDTATAVKTKKMPAGLPKQPGWLSKEERAIWDETVPALFKVGLTHEIDAQQLGVYCADMAEYVEVKTKMRKLKDDATGAARAALQKRANEAFARANKLAESFGMSYAARVRQNITMTQPEDTQTEGAPTNERKASDWLKKAKSSK